MKAERGEAQEAMCTWRSKILENSWTVLVTKFTYKNRVKLI